jgi:hypothetical protein
LCAKALRIYENERCQKKCQTPNTHTYKKGRCVKRLRTTLDIDEEVQEAIADGELTNKEVVGIAKAAIVKKVVKVVKSSKYRNLDLNRAECKDAGLRYSSKKGGCYTKCRDRRRMQYVQDQGKCVLKEQLKGEN